MMMDTAVVNTDLDRLAERVEKAAALVLDLRARLAQSDARAKELEAGMATLANEKSELARHLEETRSQLQGNDPSALVTELAALRKEQREWLAERKDVASRVESLLKKLERIEA
jgi:chromosome segregation ATPase